MTIQKLTTDTRKQTITTRETRQDRKHEKKTKKTKKKQKKSNLSLSTKIKTSQLNLKKII